MGKLNTSHLIEAVAWVAIAALFFIYSFEFNQKIEIYKFGATAWPRSILLMLMLVIAGNLFYQRANGSTPQPGRVGISEDDLDDAEKPLSSYLNIGSFLFLPLIFAWSLKPCGFLCGNSSVYGAGHSPSWRTPAALDNRDHAIHLRNNNWVVYDCSQRTPTSRYRLTIL
jgi:hypothetical protein